MGRFCGRDFAARRRGGCANRAAGIVGRAGVAAGRHRCVGTAPDPASDAPAGLSLLLRTNPEGVYPRYYPGRNAVRECNATYVQEYRPSGTVIVPRMSCFWRRRPG